MKNIEYFQIKACKAERSRKNNVRSSKNKEKNVKSLAVSDNGAGFFEEMDRDISYLPDEQLFIIDT